MFISTAFTAYLKTAISDVVLNLPSYKHKVAFVEQFCLTVYLFVSFFAVVNSLTFLVVLIVV